MEMYNNLIFELDDKGTNICSLPNNDFPKADLDNRYKRNDIELPQLSEIDVLRHFIALSNKNYHILKGMYPLGSCTMKYNPVINEDIANNNKFLDIHPYMDNEDIQGILQIIYELQESLRHIAGYDAISLSPVAGAHSEFAGMMIIREYHLSKGNKHKKNILIPDSAHGTNPASCTLSGFNAIKIKSNENGEICLEDLKKNIDENTAGIMITNPNTLGIFESNIDKIAEYIHNVDALIYMDGANLNALMGIVKPGKIGCDILHFNLHKTFSTPHGGGGPGSGGIAVNNKLKEFLPPYTVEREDNNYKLTVPSKTMGQIQFFYGNVNIMIRAWAYIKVMGKEGLKQVSKNAIINANYLRKALENIFELPYKTPTLHEFVLSGNKHKMEYGVKTLDIAKRMLDFSLHAPTIYFPLIVSEALMIEPTETESKRSLDRFIEIMKSIDNEIKENADIVKNAPHNTPIGRLNELKAMRNLNVNYYGECNG